MSNQNTYIAILGAAESGCGAAILAKKQGYSVFVSDSGTLNDKYRDELNKHQIGFEESQHSEDKILAASEIIKSPGIPDSAQIVQEIKKQGIKIIDELEFASRYTDAKLICITGSNGKTTTASLSYHILKNAGVNVALAGNIGISFARKVAEKPYDVFVLEVSSFQLDHLHDFKADVAILCNITPDHLDRYNNDFTEYAKSKMRITRNQTENDAFIFNADDEMSLKMISKTPIKAKQYSFSLENESRQGAYIEEEQIVFNIETDKFTMKLEDLALQGKHNHYNSMAGGIAAKLQEIRKESIRHSLNDFENIEHRLEYVATIRMVEFINDSKATNVNSSWYALESISKPVIWIAGGVDKGNDYGKLRPLVGKKVKAIVCLGKDNDKIREAFGDLVETIIDTETIQDATESAYYLGEPNDVVLLSPACASFDMFENYEDRGKQFKRSVQDL